MSEGPDRVAMEREAVFNEVIYGLGVLTVAVGEVVSGYERGVELALEYVKAMKEAEA